MLVLSRLKDEDIYIGPDIIVKVVDIRGNKVRLGITAPKDVEIRRDNIQNTNR